MEVKNIITGKVLYKRFQVMFDQYQTKVMDNYIPKLCRYLSVKLYEIDMIEMDTLNLVKELSLIHI